MTTFYLNNQKVHTATARGTPLLDFIRDEQGLKGTKLVCKEGECAACAVLAGSIEDGRLSYQSMCSCIMPLANANAKHIVTIEGINGAELTPVQQAMVDCHGSQCGFCTPGFVVSLTGALLNGHRPGYEQLRKAIDGNICRCTGYRPIERAAQRIAEQLPEAGFSLEKLIQRGYLPAYFRKMEAKLAALRDAEVAEQPALEPSEAPPLFLGGGTDLLVQAPRKVQHSFIRPVFDEAEFKGVRQEEGRCIIGAAATATDLQQSGIFQSVLKPEDGFFDLLSSTPIRNMSTVGGNLINASPIGDFTILLLALDSSIQLQAGKQLRKVKLKDFYLGYKKMGLRPGECLASIEFEMPQKGVCFSFEKVSTRRNLDIASVNTAAWLEFGQANIIKAIHLSAGGVGPIPLYLHQAVRFLQGKVLNNQLLQGALDVIQEEISPISDTRGSANYKRLLLRQLMLAHFHKAAPKAVALQQFLATPDSSGG